MKKRIATIVCLTLTITMLSACTNGNTGSDSKPTEEVVTTTEPVAEPTEEPDVTVTEEPEVTTTPEPVQEEDVIIELNSIPFNLSSQDPFILEDWEEFGMYFTLEDANMQYGELTLYRIDSLDTTDWTISCYPDTTQEPLSFDIFFTSQMDQYTQVVYLVDGEYEGKANFIPFFYNETRGCIVGMDVHTEYNNPADALRELYFNPTFGELQLVPVEDPSIYGL